MKHPSDTDSGRISPRRGHGEDLRADIRTARAQTLTAMVFRVIEPYICHHEGRRGPRDAHDELFKLFWNGGFEIITDMDRAMFGMPPRDGMGWTAEELRILEDYRLSEMMKPMFVNKLGGEEKD